MKADIVFVIKEMKVLGVATASELLVPPVPATLRLAWPPTSNFPGGLLDWVRVTESMSR